MNNREALGRIVRALEGAGIRYMLTGSFAGAYHGVPRASNDIDLVIQADPESLHRLGDLLSPAEYYFDVEDAIESLERHSQFNVIDLETGWKIDLIVQKVREFSSVEFERRTEAQLDELRIAVASVEDVILSKLEWSRLGESDRQIEDAANLIRVRWTDLDRKYIERWITELNIRSEWDRAVRMAGLFEA